MVFSDESDYLSFCSERSFLTARFSFLTLVGENVSLVLFTLIHLADALIQSHLQIRRSFDFVDIIS